MTSAPRGHDVIGRFGHGSVTGGLGVNVEWPEATGPACDPFVRGNRRSAKNQELAQWYDVPRVR
jgi:hypothetical protein